MQSPRFKAAGSALVFAFVGLTCSNPWFKSKDKAPDLSAKQNSKVSGLIKGPTSCGETPVQVTLQGLFQGAKIRVETQSDANGHFQMSAPPGSYWLRAQLGTCRIEQQVSLEASTEQLYSLDLQTKGQSDGDAQPAIDSKLVGGRFPASILGKPNVVQPSVVQPSAVQPSVEQPTVEQPSADQTVQPENHSPEKVQ